MRSSRTTTGTCLALSLAIHSFALVFMLLLSGGSRVDTVEEQRWFEVELAPPRLERDGSRSSRGADRARGARAPEPNRPQRPAPGQQAARNRQGRLARSRAVAPRPRGPGRRGIAIEQQDARPGQRNCLLSMRGCQESSVSPGKGKTAGGAGRGFSADRFSVFWGGPGARPAAPAVISSTEHQGLKLVRYADGGRLFSSTRGGIERPQKGLVGLLDLARGRVGGRPGRSGCDPYRVRLPGKRTLVLLLDTSSSVSATGRAGAAIYCAAGAALSALKRGYLVEVLNFSSVVVHQPPTRDAWELYATLTLVQRSGTIMPAARRLVSSSARPRDFVLITDTAIGGLRRTLPAYERAIRTHSENRATLYVLGDGKSCARCFFALKEICTSCVGSSMRTLRQLERIGFVARFVDRPAAGLARACRAAARILPRPLRRQALLLCRPPPR